MELFFMESVKLEHKLDLPGNKTSKNINSFVVYTTKN